jgi:hypothetical protein
MLAHELAVRVVSLAVVVVDEVIMVMEALELAEQSVLLLLAIPVNSPQLV